MVGPIFISFSVGNISENIALFITAIEPINNPCENLMDNKTISFGKIMGKMLAIINRRHEIRKSVLRPIASVINPTMKLPKAYPKRYNEITNLVVLSDNPKVELIDGSDGENKSIVIPVNGKNDNRINMIILLSVVSMGDIFIFSNIV
jgi:hypothetical protein